MDTYSLVKNSFNPSALSACVSFFSLLHWCFYPSMFVYTVNMIHLHFLGRHGMLLIHDTAFSTDTFHLNALINIVRKRRNLKLKWSKRNRSFIYQCVYLCYQPNWEREMKYDGWNRWHPLIWWYKIESHHQWNCTSIECKSELWSCSRSHTHTRYNV